MWGNLIGGHKEARSASFEVFGCRDHEVRRWSVLVGFPRRVFEGFEAPKRYKLLPLEICDFLVKISWKMV